MTAKTLFTSDLHFCHKNIVEFTNRGRDTTKEEHDEWLVDLWNSQVNAQDTVWHLGDFSFGKEKEIQVILSRLNGQKRFIKGNHCDAKVMHNMKRLGWIGTFDLYKEIKIKGTRTCLFHFPCSAWHQQGYGSWHLHGHCHGSFQGQGKILDVGLDSAYNHFGEHRFFTEDDIQEWMQSRAKVIVDHHKDRETEKV